MRLRFRGGIYSSPEVCGCGGCPGGYGIRPYGLWGAFIHPMGACCDGNGHGSSGTPTSAELLPAYPLVCRGRTCTARGCTEALVCGRPPGRACPAPTARRYKKPQLCVFCTAAALFTLFYALTYPASRARHRSCGCSGRGSCLRRSSRR